MTILLMWSNLLNDTNEKKYVKDDDYMIVVPILNLFKFKTDYNLDRFFEK